MTSRPRGGSDAGLIACALVLVAVCIVFAGALAWAGASERPFSTSCACAEAPE